MDDRSTFGFFDENPNNETSPSMQEVKTDLPQQKNQGEGHEDGRKNHETKGGLQRYLVFELGGNKYATPLLAAREVIEVPSFRPIPNTQDYFVGIANLRGEVIGLIDLRKMFGFEHNIHNRSSVIIYESESGPLGALIDQISGVINLDSSDISTEINIKTRVPQKYLMGIGKLPDEELVILLELKHILQEDELLDIKSMNLNVANS